MAKRKNQLANKLGGNTSQSPGWQQVINPAAAPPPAPPVEPLRDVRPQRPAPTAYQDPDSLKRKTYLLTPRLIERIKRLADDEAVGVNELVRYLLTVAVDSVEAGDLDIPTTESKRSIL